MLQCMALPFAGCGSSAGRAPQTPRSVHQVHVSGKGHNILSLYILWHHTSMSRGRVIPVSHRSLAPWFARSAVFLFQQHSILFTSISNIFWAYFT